MPNAVFSPNPRVEARLSHCRFQVRKLGVTSKSVSTPHLARDLTLYLLARLGLIAVVTGVLVLVKVPLLVAIAVAVVVGFPLGLLILRKLNARVTAGIAARNEHRARERAKLRAQLRGEE
jgi:hypothetical protein